jgi:hypothetical protein
MRDLPVDFLATTRFLFDHAGSNLLCFLILSRQFYRFEGVTTGFCATHDGSWTRR